MTNEEYCQVYSDWITLRRMATELHMDYKTVLSWSKRKVDPLPVYYPGQNFKQGRVYRPEMNDWLMRNLRKEPA